MLKMPDMGDPYRWREPWIAALKHHNCLVTMADVREDLLHGRRHCKQLDQPMTYKLLR